MEALTSFMFISASSATDQTDFLSITFLAAFFFFFFWSFLKLGGSRAPGSPGSRATHQLPINHHFLLQSTVFLCLWLYFVIYLNSKLLSTKFSNCIYLRISQQKAHVSFWLTQHFFFFFVFSSIIQWRFTVNEDLAYFVFSFSRGLPPSTTCIIIKYFVLPS